MLWKQVLDLFDILDSPHVTGEQVAELLRLRGATDVQVRTVEGDKGTTDFVRVLVPGTKGRSCGGDSPTLGIIGRLGGIGARPAQIGFVSDGDGALAALAAALKLVEMADRGDQLPGDVIVATHVCPHSPIIPHDPVPFMDAPVDIAIMNREEVEDGMEAILSVDTTRGNRIINHRGIAISPTVKEGYILRVSEDLLRIMEQVTGRLPVTFPITTQDITPYGNGVYHLNSILQPAVATAAPVVGVALTAESVVPGCGTGASHAEDVELAARFCVEVAKAYGAGQCRFYDPDEFARLLRLYGPMNHLQTLGNTREGEA